MTFACIFTGFAQICLWECRDFSCKNALVLQKSCVFPFTFAYSCCKYNVLYLFLVYFAHMCVILCLCVAVCGRQFPSRVDTLMQFYGVFWEPFMGRSYFLVQKWVRVIKVSCFSVQFCSQLSPILCFACICCTYVCVCVCDSVLFAVQSVAGSSWVELIFYCNFMMFSESRLWECRVFYGVCWQVCDVLM